MTAIEERIGALERGTVAIIGIPLDENSTFLKGAAQGPKAIREALNSGSSNMSTELGIDLGSEKGWTDLGDMSLASGADALSQIEQTVARLLATGVHVLTLGGDHSITYPILRAYSKAYPGMTVLQLDAHPDTYDEFGGSRHSHASPFARTMEECPGMALVQAGIRTLTPHLREQAQRFGITALEMRDWSPDKMPRLEGPLYLSLDLDVLDPAYAPGVSHHEPGGMSARDVLRVIHGLPSTLVGADVVELNPSRDPVGVTSMLAAKLCKELVGRMLC